MKRFLATSWRGFSKPWLIRAILLGGLIWPTLAEARELSDEQVRAAVQTWVRTVTAEARPDAAIERLEAWPAGGPARAYVVHLAGGGYCLAGGDDLVLPVYLYNPRGSYDPANPDLQHFLEEIAGRTAHLKGLAAVKAKSTLQIQLAERARFWEDLIAGEPPQPNVATGASTKGTAAATRFLLLTAQWKQGDPYYDQTPAHPMYGQHTLVGCNAIAQSQIMYYWKWPVTGTGSESVTYDYRYSYVWNLEPLATNPNITDSLWTHRLVWTNANGGQLRMAGDWDDSLYASAQDISSAPAYLVALSNLWGRLNRDSRVCGASFATTTYQWDLMSDVHPTTTEGDAAVATLCAHAGISSRSNYGLSRTGSNFDRWALHTAFGYDPDVTVHPERDASTVSNLTEEIQWMRPVALGGGNTNGGGHAWVVYGYDKSTDPNRQFLMNLGWGPGAHALWYSLDTSPYPVGGDHITHIAPAGVVKFVGNSVAGDGSPRSPYRTIEQALLGATNGTTLIFKADSTNTFSARPLVINRRLTLKGQNAAITGW